MLYLANCRDTSFEAEMSEAMGDLRLLLHRRSLLIEQLFKLGSHAVRGRVGQSVVPLFDCFIIVGLKIDRGALTPFLQLKYPQDFQLPHGIEMLCFPDAEHWAPTAVDPSNQFGRTYSLVLTDLKGRRRFGYCRRIVPEGENMAIPLVYCIISSTRAYNLYNKILRELEAQHGYDEKCVLEMLRLLHAQNFPAVSHSIYISHPGMPVKQIRRPLDARLDQPDNYQSLLQSIGVDGLIRAFLSLILERKVLVLGRCLLKISKCIECLCALLAPFEWQHLLIPVLPSSWMHVIEAPTPYLIGILINHSGILHHVLDIHQRSPDVLIVQVDGEPTILKDIEDELSEMPSDLIEPLESQLSLVKLFEEEEELQLEMDQKSPSQNMLIVEAFSKFFISLVGDTSKLIRQTNGGKPDYDVRKLFLSCNDETRSLLRTFTSTAMFHCHMSNKLLTFCTMNNVDSTVNSQPPEPRDKGLQIWSGFGSLRETHPPCESLGPAVGDIEAPRLERALIERLMKSQPVRPKAHLSRHRFLNQEIPILLKMLGAPEEAQGWSLSLPAWFSVAQLLLTVCSSGTMGWDLPKKKLKLLLDDNIEPSPSANLNDLYHIFKRPTGYLHMFYTPSSTHMHLVVH